MNTKSKLFLATVAIELMVIVLLGVKMYRRQHAPLNAVIISPLKEENFIFAKDTNLKYFREPEPSQTFKEEAEWLLPHLPAYTINADSLNERFEYPVQKPKDAFRIITLGDSFTFGLFVKTADNYSEVLEDLLNNSSRCKKHRKVEVINLGLAGLDIQQTVERFRLRGQKYDPDLVLWFLKGNEFSVISEIMDPRADFFRKQIETYGEEATFAKFGWKIADNARGGDGSASDDPLTLLYVGVWSTVVQEVNEELGEEKMLQLQESFLQSINDYYENTLLIFSFPFSLGGGKERSIIQGFVQTREDAYFYDGISNIYELGGAFPDSHPNVRGHALIAEDLFTYLTAHNLIPCG